MARTFKSLFATAQALACIVTFIGTPAAAAAPFDGSWTVSIVTHKGSCQGGSLPIQVSDGRIQSGNPSVAISGQVGESGGTSVTVGDGLRKASGSGRLAGSSGSGTWRGGLCAGTWVAQRN